MAPFKLSATKRASLVCQTAVSELPTWHLLVFCPPCECLVRRPLRQVAIAGTLREAIRSLRCNLCAGVLLDVWIQHGTRTIALAGRGVWRPSR